jgi:GT2 family glycosyltransferase
MNVQHESAAVVIVNHNSSDWLARCIAGLKQQTLTPVRIIIVDNDSQDESLTKVLESDRDIEVHRLETNTGFAAANNYAFGLNLGCEWVALLNPDAIPDPGWLEAMVEYARTHPDCAAVGSFMLDATDRTRLDGVGDAYHGSGLAWRLGNGMAVGSITSISQPVFSVCAGAALYDYRIIQQIGGFEESFFCYFEDVDLGFRLRLAGYSCGVQERAVVYHAGSASTGKRSDFSVYHGQRNMIWAYIRNMPGYLFWLYLPQHVVLNLLFLLLGVWRGQGRVTLKAKLDAIKGIRCALEQRHDIQKSGKVHARNIRKAMTGSTLDWFRSRAY